MNARLFSQVMICLVSCYLAQRAPMPTVLARWLADVLSSQPIMMMPIAQHCLAKTRCHGPQHCRYQTQSKRSAYQRVKEAGIEVLAGHAVTTAAGNLRVGRVEICPVSEDGKR